MIAYPIGVIDCGDSYSTQYSVRPFHQQPHDFFQPGTVFVVEAGEHRLSTSSTPSNCPALIRGTTISDFVAVSQAICPGTS